MTKPKGDWTDGQIADLRAALASGVTPGEFAAQSGRTVAAIVGMCKSRRYGGGAPAFQRTEARRLLMLELYETKIGPDELLARINELPGPKFPRQNGLGQWAKKLGLRRPIMARVGKWTPERDALVVKLVSQGTPDSAIRREVNKLPGARFEGAKAIFRRVHALGLERMKKPKEEAAGVEPAWSASDLAHLRAQVGKVSHRVLAQQLGKSRGAVQAKASRLGLLGAPSVRIVREPEAKPPAVLKPPPPRKIEAAPPRTIGRPEMRYRGMRDIAQWFHVNSGAEAAGKPFVPVVDINAVNALCRKLRKPYIFGIVPVGNIRWRGK